MKEITLREYIELEKKQLDDFKREWERHVGDKNYPQTLTAGEWMEQFLAIQRQ